LKDELQEKHSLAPASDTDSEIVALFIGVFLDQQETIVEAIKKTCLKLIGSYNIALIYNQDPGAIYALRNSGDISIG
jgi:glucosamine 6-phosphate synthetase-like amidotransferase/phosphosugar isomerase protein